MVESDILYLVGLSRSEFGGNLNSDVMVAALCLLSFEQTTFKHEMSRPDVQEALASSEWYEVILRNSVNPGIIRGFSLRNRRGGMAISIGVDWCILGISVCWLLFRMLFGHRFLGESINFNRAAVQYLWLLTYF